MNLRSLGALAFVAAALLADSGLASTSAPAPARTSTTYMTPVASSRSCSAGAPQRASCQVVTEFFHAMNSRRFGKACMLLGEQLRSDTHGLSCTRFLALGMPEAMPWGILEAHETGRGVSLLVTLGISELDRVRMLHHRAYVAPENGRLRIVATRVVS